MRYFSLFSGVGGFELGIEKAYGQNRRLENQEGQDVRLEPARPEEGHLSGDGGVLPERDARLPDAERPSCVGFSEIDKHASAVLRYRFPNVKNYGDITKIDWAGVPDFDLLVGGSPCQDLSIAGKRAGLEGARSGLFHAYVKALHEKKPEFFIWENVKGALSSNQGRDFGAVLSALAEAGYSLWWQVLNAKDFGVPQNRERVFVVGTRNGSPREVFFERGDDGETSVHALTPPGTSDAFRVYGTDGVSKTLAANGGGTGAKTGLIPFGSSQDQKLNSLDGPSQTLSAGHFNQPKIAVVIDHGKVRETEDRSNMIGANYGKGLDNHGQRTGVMVTGQPRYDAEGKRVMDYRTTEEAPCIRATQYKSGDNQPRLLQDARIRRLTPIECERLMSWPDNWTEFGAYDNGHACAPISDTQRYKMCGNGVVSEVVAAVVKAHLL